MQTDNTLAIVIPAYKAKYLDKALKSVAAQTNKNFKLYVCDDASKDDIKAIARRYENEIAIHYHRFAENVGGTDLVKQWNRSVKLADADWIWLFSDDDILSPGSVQSFFDALKLTAGKYDLYRFNIEMIDADGNVISAKQPHPAEETSFGFLKRRLLSKSLSAAIEYIFKKETFNKNGGFVNLPMAWCADDATWIQFAGSKPIYTVQQGRIYWRSSGINISSSGGFQSQKADAIIKFIHFIVARFPDKKNEILMLAEPWLYESLNYINGKLSLLQSVKLSGKIDAIFKPAKPTAFKKLVAFRLKNTRFAAIVQRW